ncbi:MAG: glycosyl hydrolase 53 family protein [Lachnospiraceae bacterium]|nr:glycosyl hydrolase 53 family protein [Lachnospiraceae bacterium]
MKKVIITLLCILLIFGLCACTKSGQGEGGSGNGAASSGQDGGNGTGTDDNGGSNGNEAGSNNSANGSLAENGDGNSGSNNNGGISDNNGAGSNAVIIPQVPAPEFAGSKETANVFVAPIEGISDDFYRGVDISTILAQEASGVKYYDAEGNEKDLFDLLADAGVNYIRVRVWNDPYDADGNGYGGGNCDTQTAAVIGRRAAEHGMKLLVDYHYSDFWADPGKQFCPKAWNDMEIWDKADACYTFTLESLNAILDAGADVGMVQIGNEINNGMSGEKQYSFVCSILNGGAKAIREVSATRGRDIKIAVHYANPEKPDAIIDKLNRLKSNEVDYDVVGLSYYPFWHGTLENLIDLMNKIRTNYGKEVMVAETSYAYTLEEGDGNGNSVSEKDLNKNYAATVQSQVNAIRDVCEAVVKANGLGVFYWEPAWIPVQYVDWSSSDASSVYASNKAIWEKYGSGWASSYAGSYDPKDAGKYYGGSAWDNQAWFDFNGRALPSLYTYKYLKYGTECDLKVDFANDATVIISPGSELNMPETVDVHFNDRSKNGPAAVKWNDAEIAAVDTGNVGEYYVTGNFEDGTPIGCKVLIQYINLVSNPSFEDGDRSMYKLSGNCGDYQKKESDATTGEWSLHFWSESEVSMNAEQTISGLEDGTYSFSLKAQGGDVGSSPEMFIYVQVGDMVYRQDFNVDGWVNWKNPKIDNIAVSGGSVTIGVSIKTAAKGWGTIDDFYLCKTK